MNDLNTINVIPSNELPKTFLTAEWKYLLMANYVVDPNILKPYLPFGVELDLFENQAFISLVAFEFSQTKLKGWCIPFHSTFPEINLRFYVKRQTADGWRRGVVFISEFVNKPAITWVANSLYKENYKYVPIRYDIQHQEDKITLNFSWKLQQWNRFKAMAANKLQEILPNSEADFIYEHYFGYSLMSQEKTVEYQVAHKKWELYPVEDYTIEVDFGAVYGKAFEPLNAISPSSVLLANGSPISVFERNSF